MSRFLLLRNGRSKFIFVSLVLIGLSLLAMLAPVPSMAVKPLTLDRANMVQSSAMVSLDVDVLSADPMARTLTLDWYPRIAALDCVVGPFTTYDIHISPDIIDSSSPYWAPTAPYPPLFKMNVTDICQNVSKFSGSTTFRTVTKLLGSSPQRSLVLHNRKQSSLQDYPFDVYIAPMKLWVVDQASGRVLAPNITQTSGVAVNFEVSLPQVSRYIIQYGLSHLEGQLMLVFRVERSVATKAFVIMVAITNWLTAITFTIMCAAAIVYRSHRIYSEMFVLPVGVVFAFASIRQNMPGAPNGFGTTLDMYSTLPFLVIMTFAGLTLILLVLFRRIKENHRSDDQKGPLDLEATGSDAGTMPVGERTYRPCSPVSKPDAENGDNTPSARSTEEISSSRNSGNATRVPTPELNKETSGTPVASDEVKGDKRKPEREAEKEPNLILEEEGQQTTKPQGHAAKIDVGISTEAP